jgi:hypothetical protein
MVPTNTKSKNPMQKRIEYISLGIWIALCALTLIAFGKGFATGVFLGGAICLLNNQWLAKHAKMAITLPGRRSTAYMTWTYLLRMGTLAIIILALITWAKVNVIALLIGLSVVMLSIISYACYTTLFDRGE